MKTEKKKDYVETVHTHYKVLPDFKACMSAENRYKTLNLWVINDHYIVGLH